MNGGGGGGGFFLIIGWDDREGSKNIKLDGGGGSGGAGGGGAGLFLVFVWENGEGGRGIILYGVGIAVFFSSAVLGEVDADKFWSSSCRIFHLALRSLQVLFIQGMWSNLINVIRQPWRRY